MTKRQSAENIKLLDKRLQREDEDRWLSSRYAPKVARERLIALYAFNLELAKVRTIVSEPGLGAIRFQWWREAIGELAVNTPARKHDVVQALAMAKFSEKLCLGLIDGHEVAFEAKDRSLEPEGLLMRAAASLLVSVHSWSEHIEQIAPAYAKARQGTSAATGPIVPKVPALLRPAIAHAVLRFTYAYGKPPGGLRKRFAVMGAMLSGRV
jgi:phytoene synthase